jgi:riboflavin kinase/FMN adenylyltransferase
VAIGNFDGVHLGHRHLLEKLADYGRAHGLTPSVLTFDPNPAEWFKSKHFSGYLFNSFQKLRALRHCQIELVLAQNFDDSFAGLTPEEFMKDVLVDSLNAHAVVVGDDFRFGKNRSGHVSVLRDYFHDLGRSVIPLELFSTGGQTPSSSLIRKSLEDGDLSSAIQALGRPYVIEGDVIHGRKLARSLDFPTANLDLGKYVKPKFGVYGGRVLIHKGRQDLGTIDLDSAAPLAAINIGMKPTFSNSLVPLLEVHFIDTKMDLDFLYGKRISVFFQKFIRAEHKFSSPLELKEQIRRDVDQIKSIF